MKPSYDVIVVGLGTMGAATIFHLARQGAKVLGLDTHQLPHALGSSHGETRVIREAYFEHPSYVPLVRRAYALWHELEQQSGTKLLLQTGGLMIGPRQSTVVSGAIRSALEHHLPHEILSVCEIRQRFPGLQPSEDMVGVLEPRAGILFAERCIEAHLAQARAAGAVIRTGQEVLEWAASEVGARVRTADGVIDGGSLVLAGGPWMPGLLPELRRFLTVERQVHLWFGCPEGSPFDATYTPIHLWEYEPDKMFYGIPDLGTGLKLAFHHQGEITTADSVDRSVRDGEIQRMRELMARYLPEAARFPFLRGAVCLYTNTPDGHFILDHHPRHANVIVVSPCSGHGFKFASALGEVLAALALRQVPSADLSLFSLQRFQGEN